MLAIMRSNSSGSLGSTVGKAAPWDFILACPLARRCFSNIAAFLVLARKTASLLLAMEWNKGLPQLTIRQIAQKRHKTDKEVNNDVKHHLRLNSSREATLYLLACPIDHHCHECINRITEAIARRQLRPRKRQKITTHPGIMPMTLPQPNLIPQQLNKLISSL